MEPPELTPAVAVLHQKRSVRANERLPEARKRFEGADTRFSRSAVAPTQQFCY
jgi:hypothetical protein